MDKDLERHKELANVALTLGDFFVPPKGTVICKLIAQCGGHWVSFQYLQVISESTDKIAFITRPYDQDGRKAFGNLYWVFLGDHFYIDELPAACPPFEEWKRPRRLYDQP